MDCNPFVIFLVVCNFHLTLVQEVDFFFGSRKRNGTATFGNSTLCIIKPHAIVEQLAGKIITAIMNSEFKITALQMFHLEKANTEEFLEVYKGVVTEYKVRINFTIWR